MQIFKNGHRFGICLILGENVSRLLYLATNSFFSFQRLAEHGLLVRERKHWHPRKPECIQSSKSIRFNVGLDEFYPALLILLVGILSSLTILVVEKQIRFFWDRSVYVPPIFVFKPNGDTVYPYVE